MTNLAAVAQGFRPLNGSYQERVRTRLLRRTLAHHEPPLSPIVLLYHPRYKRQLANHLETTMYSPPKKGAKEGRHNNAIAIRQKGIAVTPPVTP